MAKNNSPVITSTAAQAAASITELAGVTGSTVVDTVTNTLTFTDLDTTDTHTVSFTPQAAGFVGTFTPLLTHDSTGGVTGSVQWTFTVSDGALDFLAAGQTLVQSYTVTIADNRGGTVTQVVTLTLTGTNDAPTITSTVAAATGAVTELAGTTGSAALDAASGTLTFKDVDLTDTHAASFAPQGAGYLGSFALGVLTDSTNGATGSVGWSFSVVDGALDFLAAGQTLVQSYNVTVADNHGGAAVQVVTVTLTGTNDAPTITSTAAAAAGAVTELAALTASTATDSASGTLTFKDVDLTDTHTATAVAQSTGYLGSFTLGTVSDSTGGATGSVGWHFTVVDGALDFLAAGQTLVQSYNVTVADPNGGTAVQVVTVTLTGTNDAPVITSTAAAASGSVTELAGVTASPAVDTATGTLTFTDVDLLDIHTVSAVAQGTGYVGALTFGAVTEGTSLAPGSVKWTFSTPDGALDFLAAGQTQVQSYTVTVADNHGGTAAQVVTVTITGTNDTPTITSTAAAATGSVTELAGVSGSTATDLATGTLTFKDVDVIDTHTATVVAQGAGYLGTFTLGAIADSTGGVTGSVAWTFSVVDGALDFLAAGQTLVQSYNVTVADNHGGTAVQVVTVTLTGTNDAPVAQAIAGAATTTGPAVTLTASYTDLDLIDTHTFAVNTVGTLGLVTNNGNGTFGYNPNGQFASLALGQTATDHFTYTVADNHGGTSTQTATVTIAGANHAPVITSSPAAASGSVIELAGVTGSAAVDTATAALTFTDADPTDLHTASVVALGTGYLGVFSLGTVAESNVTGVVVGSVPWSFSVVDGALDFLAAGQTLAQSYSVKIADPNGGTVVQTVTVTLTGANDAPTIAATTIATGAVVERPAVLGSPLLDTTTGIVAFKDVDLTDTHTVSVAPQAAGYLGTLTLGTRTDSTNGVTGSVPWSFSVVDSALDFLSAGQTLVQNYNVTVADNHGGAVVQVVTVTLTGSNDAPVLTSLPFVASVNEHGPGVTLTPSFTDVDLLDQHVFTVDTTGTRGLVTNIQGGTIVYDPNGAFASLNVGQTAVDHFTYSVVDNNGASATQTATVTIIGQNDAPVAHPDTISVAAGTTSANLWTTLLANDTDVDTAHTALVISSVNTNGTTGSVSLNTATHSLTYRAPAGGAPDSFQYTVSDGQGGSSSTTVTVNADHLVTDNWVVSPGQIATFSAASVLANDTAAGGGVLTLLAVSGPNASLSGGVITYSSPGGASDSFTYTTVDSHGTQATGTVNVSLWDGSSTPVGSATNQAEWLVGSSTAPITMIGTAVADHLQGSVGNDIITGGGGADVLTGGGGINHFIYNNAGTIGAGASNKDSSLGAMDHITDFVSGTDIIELNGFGFSAASTAAVTATNLKAKPFTSGDVAGYFADGNVIHFEKQTTTVSAQIYIDANKDGSFEAASDIVIHLDHSKGVTNLDFQFH